MSAESRTDLEIVSIRVFDAPVGRVFKAWADPEFLARWWGPRGFTNTFEEFDFRPGGHWRFIMHGPDGTDYRNHSVFVEILEGQRIIFDHLSSPTFRILATFSKQDGQTTVRFCMRFESVAECQRVKVIAVEGNEQNFDRLAAVLTEMPSTQASELVR